ncbi:MAG: tetratricopeptide repeat protein [Chloroflexi bacterium]|nr:tetratricopeptide repeat protein [Chloroflexota bacterium]
MTSSPTLHPLRITTFGGFSAEVGGTPIKPFISRKVDALLVYLACTRREHPREALGAMLWDDLTQERTMGNLRTALSDLQKQLGPYLAISRYTVGIDPAAPVWVDYGSVVQALNQADRTVALHETLSAVSADQLKDALLLYTGDFLRGFAIKSARGFEGWYLLEAERIRGHVIEAYGRLTDYAIAKRLYKQGIESAMRALQIDPLWEPAHRALIKLLALTGQRSQALAQYETCVKLLDEELGLEPDAQTEEVMEQIASGELAPQEEASSLGPIALPDLPFVARPALQQRLDSLLARPDVRVVSLVGPGGSGKTRLALDSAARLSDQFPDGAAVVALDHVQDAGGTIAAIVGTLRLSTSELPLERRLIEHLYGRELLLIFDTAEQVVGIADLVERLVTAARSIKVLVTSQTRLNIKAEHVIAVDGLEAPDEAAAAASDYPAVRLFALTVERLSGHVDLSEELNDVIELCRVVEGNPLAIELAAAWTRLMPTAQILDEIRRSGDFLTYTGTDVPERQRSMRAVFEWTWQHLDERDRRAATKLAVFNGDFWLDTAVAVTGEPALVLTSLADRSLMSVRGGRCHVHPLLRGFLAEKLAADPEIYEQAVEALCDEMVNWCHEIVPQLANYAANDSLAEFVQDIDNLNSAWQHAIQRRRADWVEPLTEGFFYYYKALNNYSEGVRHLQQALDVFDSARDHRLYARVSAYYHILLTATGGYSEVREALAAAIEQLPPDDLLLRRQSYAALAHAAYGQGDFEAAKVDFENALDYAQQMDDYQTAALILFRLGDIAAVYGSYEEARSLLMEGFAFNEDAATSNDRVRFLNLLADVDCKVGDYEAALRDADSALRAGTMIGSRVQRAVALATLGRASYGLGDYAAARDYLKRSVAQAEEIENRWGKAFALAHLVRVSWRLNEMTAARFHLDKASSIASELQSAWLTALVQRMRALPGVDRRAEPIQAAALAAHLAASIGAVPLQMGALSALAQALLHSGQVDDAVDLARVVLDEPRSEADAREACRLVLDTVPGTVTRPPITRQAAGELAVRLAVTSLSSLHG